MRKKLYDRIFSIVTAITMLISFVNIDTAAAASSSDIMPLALTDGVGNNKAADEPTMDNWRDILKLDENSRYAGRVWADKTVREGKDNDFEHIFSLLGSGLKENRSSMATPLDVVFILDTSYSMASNSSEYGGTENNVRLMNSALALNNAMSQLMDTSDPNTSPYNRVGLVTFDSGSDVAMELGRYNSFGGKYFTPINNTSISINATNGEGGNKKITSITPKLSMTNTLLSPESGYTNTQAGIFNGMKMLAEATDTIFWVNEEGKKSSTEQPGWTKIKRRPIVILLSDGVPTRLSTSASWWVPSVSPRDNDGSLQQQAYPGLSMIAMAVGSYMRREIEWHYKEETFNVFTLGLELPSEPTFGLFTGGVTQDEVDLAPLTLNPSLLYNEKYSTDMKNEILTYWNEYKTKGSVSLQISGKANVDVRSKYYTMKKPTGNIQDIDDLNYVDKYYDVQDANNLEDYFKEIVDGVIKEAKPIPIPVAGMNDAGMDDVITYTDPIGLYMEVKEVNTLELFGKPPYPLTKDRVEGNRTYYTAGSGLIFNPAYGNEPETLNKDDLGVFDLSDIRIWVEDTGDYNDEGGHLADTGFRQALYVEIPAEAMPLHWAELDFDSSNKLTGYKYDTDQMPLRITYDVGIADKYLTGGKVDLNKISPEYKIANTKDDGMTYFYSNYFSNTTYDDYTDGDKMSRGDAVVTFSPSEDNRYYVFRDTPALYKCDDQGDIRPPELSDVSDLGDAYTGELDDDTWYYIIIDYYTKALEHKQVAVARKGSELIEGGQRVGDMSGGVRDKQSNITGTADTYYLPVIRGSGKDATISVYCGNNGYLAVGESLMLLTKELETIYLPNASGEEFGFSIECAALSGDCTAIVVNYNYAADTWQKKISSFKLQTDNDGNLLRKDGSESGIYLQGAEGKGAFNAVDGGEPASGFSMKTYITEEKYSMLPAYLRSKYEKNDGKAGITEICYGDTVLATIYPDDSIVSDYITESTYETKHVTFDGGKATVSLKGGEGLLFSLDSGTALTITENLTPDQVKANYRLKAIQHTGGKNVAVTLKERKTECETDAKEMLHINYINSKFYKTQTHVNGKDVSLEEKEDGLLIGPDVSEGMDITYNIGWANDAIKSENGEPIAADITIIDTLDEGVYFSGAAFDPTEAIIAYPGNNWSKSGGDGAAKYTYTKAGKTIVYDEQAHTVTWKFNAEKATSGKVTLQVTVNDKAAKKTTEKVENIANIQVENGSTVDTNYVENPVTTFDLTVSKTVSGSGGDQNAKWTFSISLTLPEGAELSKLSYTGTGGIQDGSLTLTKKSEGVYTADITLKHGQSITLKDIPKGTRYTVTENEANQKGYTTKVTGTGTVTSANDSITGTLEADETVKFENECQTGRLELEKEVDDFDSSVDTEEFTFNVTLDDTSETEPSVDYSYTKIDAEQTDEISGILTFERGADGKYTAEIGLKHGEKIVIYGIKYETAFEVTENSTDGYGIKDIITVSGSVTSERTGRRAYGSVTEESPVAGVKYINERKITELPGVELPNTGGSGVMQMYNNIAGVILMSFALLYEEHRKRKHAKTRV